MKKIQLACLFVLLLLISPKVLKSQISDVEITYQVNTDNSVDVNFKKQLVGTYLINIEFDQLSNCENYSSAKYTYSGTIRGRVGKVLTLKPKDPNMGIGFSFSYQYHRGKPFPKIKENFVYLLPFSKGTKVKVNHMNYLGKRFGKGAPDSWKAFQFITEKSEPVVAMRKGVVVEVKDQFVADTTKDFHYNDNVNEVLIEHRDGTLARYSCFKSGSICVKEGQTVHPNTKLGLTGWYSASKKRELHVFIYYLKIRMLEKLEDEENKQNAYAYIDPLFYHKGDKVNLLSGNLYVSDSNDELITQEFTRREKKKYSSSIQ
ncbi:M23 family metallopeptidase [Marinifilum caeruleilacunae]|uniref:M23ase beta-sheet core domain-containing protein n=1 Tax=Marinifilum caeruleilacunae TaxID=2499076 RepID=A0ABX1WUD0_9BACT|nr:M23 family metallopeptidase [Marinifilum caeruleilacunae]NOU59539.1 hypothetical protein [Marinifilum caeruleilacunae]